MQNEAARVDGRDNIAQASWSAAVLCRFRLAGIFESGRGQPHSKTLRPHQDVGRAEQSVRLC
jgi:hypothetical protein